MSDFLLTSVNVGLEPVKPLQLLLSLSDWVFHQIANIFFCKKYIICTRYVYVWCVCVTQTPLGVDYKDCLIEKNEKFHLAGVHSSFDTLRWLTDFYKENTLVLSDIPVKLGRCCPPQAKGTGQMSVNLWADGCV